MFLQTLLSKSNRKPASVKLCKDDALLHNYDEPAEQRLDRAVQQFLGPRPGSGRDQPGRQPFGASTWRERARVVPQPDRDQRFILGGGWNDPPYRSTTPTASRSVRPLTPRTGSGWRATLTARPTSRVRGPAQPPFRDFEQARPGSTPSSPPIAGCTSTTGRRSARAAGAVDEGDWTREAGRAGDRRLRGRHPAALPLSPQTRDTPLPHRGLLPPGSNAIGRPRPTSVKHDFDFLLKSGRAVLYPVYKGTYQRRDSLALSHGRARQSTNFHRDHVIMWAKDLRRGWTTRKNAPSSHRATGYYGVSRGGALGGLLPAVEPSIKASVLGGGGARLPAGRGRRWTRSTSSPGSKITDPDAQRPVRLLLPDRDSQQPMFRLLGTPPAQKRQVVEEGAIYVPRPRRIQETLGGWIGIRGAR